MPRLPCTRRTKLCFCVYVRELLWRRCSRVHARRISPQQIHQILIIIKDNSRALEKVIKLSARFTIKINIKLKFITSNTRFSDHPKLWDVNYFRGKVFYVEFSWVTFVVNSSCTREVLLPVYGLSTFYSKYISFVRSHILRKTSQFPQHIRIRVVHARQSREFVRLLERNYHRIQHKYGAYTQSSVCPTVFNINIILLLLLAVGV